MFGRGTLQTVFSGFAVEQGKQSRDRLCYTQLKAGRACGCSYDGWIGSRFILAMTLELWRCNFAQLVVWRLHFTSQISLRAGKAWPRSEHTGSLLPDMLRGKSSCLGAESATGRPEDLGTRAISEAQVELWFWCFGPLQQQSHAVSVCKNANRTGLTLSMPSSNRCLAEAHFKPCFLDSQLSKANNQETDCAIHNWKQDALVAARMMAGLVADSFWQWHWNFDVVTLRS